jgi:hypothetical protein
MTAIASENGPRPTTVSSSVTCQDLDVLRRRLKDLTRDIEHNLEVTRPAINCR